MNSLMLEAFLKQQKFTDKQADAYSTAVQVIKEKNLTNAQKELNKCQEIKKYINIPSKIHSDNINQKTIPHPKLKSYDHSLESVRLTFKSEPQELISTPKTPIGTQYKLPEGNIGIDWNSLAKTLNA